MQNYLELPDSNLHIIPGCQVKLSRFDTTIWSVAYGWYTWGGNRSVCGWYLYNTYLSEIKPLQETDLDDIYLIESPSYPHLDNCPPPPIMYGESAYELAVKHGFKGTEEEWLESLKGDKGADGKDGVDGQNGIDGKNGVDGQDGADGIGISESQINANGQLVLTYTNGQSTNLGRVVGKDGQDCSLDDGSINTVNIANHAITKEKLSEDMQNEISNKANFKNINYHSPNALNTARSTDTIYYVYFQIDCNNVAQGTKGILFATDENTQILITDSGNIFYRYYNLTEGIWGEFTSVISQKVNSVNGVLPDNLGNVDLLVECGYGTDLADCTDKSKIYYFHSGMSMLNGNTLRGLSGVRIAIGFIKKIHTGWMFISSGEGQIKSNYRINENGGLIRIGSTYNYNDLINKPTINNVELTGNRTLSDLNLYSKSEVDNLISLLPKFDIKVVENLPTEEISNTTLYLVPSDGESPNMYTEYIYVNDIWEKLGEQTLDLSDYIKTVNGIAPDENGNVDIPQLTAGDGIKIENNVISLNLPLYSGGVVGGDPALRDLIQRDMTEFAIPDGTTSIGNNAFTNCTSLTSVTIPDSVTSIGASAFYGCSKLTSITIPSSVTSIGDNAFGYCTSLSSVTIPSSVTGISDWAFNNCSKLTDVTIPSSVTSVGNYAFNGCRAMEYLAVGVGVNASINISYSTKFTRETLRAIIDNYADRTGQSALTLTIGSKNLEKLTEEDKEIAYNKNLILK